MGGNREGHVFPRVMPNYLQQARAPADSLSALCPLICVLEGQSQGTVTVGSLALWIPMGGNSRGSKGGRREKSEKFSSLSSLHGQTSAKLRPMSGESKILH